MSETGNIELPHEAEDVAAGCDKGTTMLAYVTTRSSGKI
jgi:hypothetical protein